MSILGGVASMLGLPGMMGGGTPNLGQSRLFGGPGIFGGGGIGQSRLFGGPGMTGDGSSQGLVGGLQDWLFGSPTQKIGGPEDISQVNPYTDSFMQQLQGQGQNVWNQMMQGAEGLGQNQFWPGMQSAIGGIDPLAAQNYFQNNAAGGYRDIANQNFEQFNTANQAVADRMSNQAVQNIGSQFANRGPGSLRSSGAMQAIGEGAINPLLQSNAQIGQMIGGQAGQLQGQGMSNLFNAFNTANQQRLSGQGALMDDATRRDLGRNQMLSGLYGQMLGQQGQIAAPSWYQQQYMDNPNYMGVGDIATTGAQIAGMFA